MCLNVLPYLRLLPYSLLYKYNWNQLFRKTALRKNDFGVCFFLFISLSSFSADLWLRLESNNSFFVYIVAVAVRKRRTYFLSRNREWNKKLSFVHDNMLEFCNNECRLNLWLILISASVQTWCTRDLTHSVIFSTSYVCWVLCKKERLRVVTVEI